MRALGWMILFATASFPQAPTKQKIKAIHDLAKAGGTGALVELRGYLKDPEDEVRREAVRSIVSVGTQHSLDALVEATRDRDEEIQIRATDGLVNFYAPGYADTGLSGSLRRLGRGVKSRFTDTNDRLIDLYIEVRPDVIDSLTRLIREGTTLDSRANAARGAGVLRGRAALEALYDALGSRETQLIYEALVAIRKIADPASVSRISFLLHDLNERVQLAAIEVTGVLRNKAALGDLGEALRRARNTRVRAAALSAIAMIPDEASRPLYETYSTAKEEELRAAAAEGYARLAVPGDGSNFVKLFEAEKKMKPRLAWAFASVAAGRVEPAEPSPLTFLVNTLNSTFWRGVASAYLEELTRQLKVRQSLYPGMAQRTKDEKIELCGILSRNAGADATAVLEDLTRDAGVNQAAARALRNLRARLETTRP